MYFIVSPKDIVTARQRDEDDHVSWLLEHEMFVVGTRPVHQRSNFAIFSFSDVALPLMLFVGEQEGHVACDKYA